MAATALEGIEELRHWGRPVVTTAEVAKRLRLADAAASQLMRRLAALGAVVRIQRGRWLLRTDTPMLAVPYLALPHLAYATGFWALASYDMIDQTPRAVEVATGGRSRSIEVRDIVFELHHLEPRLLDGWVVREEIIVATPEKALFDAVYIRTARGISDVRLPEVDLPSGFNTLRLHRWTDRIDSAKVKLATERSLDRVIELSREVAGESSR